MSNGSGWPTATSCREIKISMWILPQCCWITRHFIWPTRKSGVVQCSLISMDILKWAGEGVDCHRALPLVKCGLSQPSRAFQLCYHTCESRDSLSPAPFMSFSPIPLTTLVFQKKMVWDSLCDPHKSSTAISKRISHRHKKEF